MARLTDNEKKLVIADYKTGKYSQRELAERHHISVGTVNNLTKDLKADNEQFVQAQISLLTAKALLPPEQMNAILNAAQEEIYNKGLVTNATQLNLVRMTEHISVNKKLEKVNVGDGIQQFEEVGLGSGDYLNIQNAIDRASLTLKINDRHAPKTDINLTNAQQNNTRFVGMRRMSDDEKRKALEENGRNITS